MRYCRKKKCTIVYGQRQPEYYEAVEASASKMEKEIGIKGKSAREVKEDDYVEKTIQ